MILLSPAKNMKFDQTTNLFEPSSPYFSKETNYLINKLRELTKTQIKKMMKLSDNLSNLKKYDIAKTKQAGNPISFYEGLIQYLKSNELETLTITVRNMPNKKVSNASIVRYLQDRPLVEYFILDRFSEEYKNNSWTIPQKYKVEKNGVTYTYVLDSAVVRDTKKQHFSAYITCNGKSFAFDGESFARMTPFEWKKKLNKNTQWRFAEQYETYFNFNKGYQLLIYYRDS